MTGLGPLSIDIYLPAFPAIARDLASDASEVQLTLTSYFAGFALTQLFAGALADRFGRRPVLLNGTLVFVLGSMLCAGSPSIDWLIAARFLQGSGGAVAPVVARAVVRDLYSGRAAGRVLGYLASAMAVAPLLAPVVGGYLELWFGWQATFHALTFTGLLLYVWARTSYRETLSAPVTDALHLSPLLRYSAMLLSNQAFLGYTLCMGLGFALLFSWISSAPYVLMGQFGISSHNFGYVFGFAVIGYGVGAYAGARLVSRRGVALTVLWGVSLCIVAAVGLTSFAFLAEPRLTTTVLWVMLALFGTAMMVPSAMAGAMTPHPSIAGIASALIGVIQMIFAIMATILSSWAYDGTDGPMVTLILLSALMAGTVFLLMLRPALSLEAPSNP